MRLADHLLELSPEVRHSIAWQVRSRDEVRSWTWWDVERLTTSAAQFLLDHSVRPGDRVVNLGGNSLAWAILDLACSAINAVHVPIDPRFSTVQKAHCIESVMPKVVFADALTGKNQLLLAQLDSLALSEAPLADVCSSFEPSDLANILFTSGTTGCHRGVMLSHSNLVSNAYAKLDAMPQSLSDRRLNFLPFSHAYARTCELTTWLISHSCMEVARGMEEVFERASDCEPTLINGVPVFYSRLAAKWEEMGPSRSDLYQILGKRIRRLASGGATLENGLREKFALAGLPIYQGYGLTESSPVICSNRSADGIGESNLTEVGPPVAGMTIKIDGNSRLWVSGSGVMLGYWNDPESTRAKLIDGWLDTGDLAEYAEIEKHDSAQSCLRILGRADDTIVLSSGYKVPPLPIEQIIGTESWVSQCLLVGAGHPFPILIVVPNAIDGECIPSRDEMFPRVESLLSDFPSYAIPRRLIVVEEPWTYENGMANFKGGLIRSRIQAQVQHRIQQCLQRDGSLDANVW